MSIPTSEILITNIEKLELTKQAISNAGLDKFHVVADFDRTLTKVFVNGQDIPSLISILRHDQYLTPDYAPQAHALYDKYHAIEIDPMVTREEKIKAMHEWWTTHFDLLVKCKLNKKDLEKVVNSGRIKLRHGANELFLWLHTHQVPLLIFSSSGVGGESIGMFLKKSDQLYDNIHIISNVFEWDKDDYLTRVKEPIIHGMNKNEHAIQGYPIFKLIKNRKNVLLLGDSISDVGMVKGLDCENIIKVGFLNENVEKNLEEYKKYFDILILNDGEMNFVNQLLTELF